MGATTLELKPFFWLPGAWQARSIESQQDNLSAQRLSSMLAWKYLHHGIGACQPATAIHEAQHLLTRSLPEKNQAQVRPSCIRSWKFVWSLQVWQQGKQDASTVVETVVQSLQGFRCWGRICSFPACSYSAAGCLLCPNDFVNLENLLHIRP